MPPRKRGKKDKKSSSSKGSRQKDRDDEKVEFISQGDPVFIDRPGSANFLQVERKEAIGKDSGDLKSDFVQLQPGFYNDDNDPCYNKRCKECGKGQGLTWAASMTPEMADAIEGTMTEEEYEEWQNSIEEED